MPGKSCFIYINDIKSIVDIRAKKSKHPGCRLVIIHNALLFLYIQG